MSTLSDITELMGELLLKGWVLTDKSCPTRGCAVPLMRSPRGQVPEVSVCAKCSGNSSDEQASPSASTVTQKSRESIGSRLSTPLTEMSSDDEEEFVLPPETEESRRRREQSDRASSEIGARLLKGWAMLGEECPNSECHGVPLVRPPSQGGEKDPRKECVICGNVYLPKDAAVPTPEPPVASVSQDNIGGPSDIIKESNPLPTPPAAQRVFVPPSSSQSAFDGRRPQLRPSSAVDALAAADQALQTSLNALSARMAALSSSSPLDIISIGNTADAIGKVVHALSQVKPLQWGETQQSLNP